MKYSVVLALAAAATATPFEGQDGSCSAPGTYRCAPSNTKIEVCAITGQTTFEWVLQADCAPTEKCIFLDANKTPYCVDKYYKGPESGSPGYSTYAAPPPYATTTESQAAPYSTGTGYSYSYSASTTAAPYSTYVPYSSGVDYSYTTTTTTAAPYSTYVPYSSSTVDYSYTYSTTAAYSSSPPYGTGVYSYSYVPTGGYSSSAPPYGTGVYSYSYSAAPTGYSKYYTPTGYSGSAYYYPVPTTMATYTKPSYSYYDSSSSSSSYYSSSTTEVPSYATTTASSAAASETGLVPAW